MYSDNKLIRDIADVAARIMSGQQPVTEKLHPNQQQLDVHEPEKDELTSDDFKKLRAKKEVKKEEVEELDELSKDTLKSYYKGSVESGMKAQNRAMNTSMGGSDSEHKKNITDINKRVSGQDAVTKRLGSKETMSTTQFIDELAAGNASGAKDILNDMLSARAFEALEGRKVEIAQNIFNGSQPQEVATEE